MTGGLSMHNIVLLAYEGMVLIPVLAVVVVLEWREQYRAQGGTV